jgi:short-subunit dehydrogenase
LQAFVEMFSKSMSVELRGKGVTVADHVPLFVATKMAIPNEKRRKGSMFTPWPAQWAAASLRAVGYESFTVPYWPHALQVRVVVSGSHQARGVCEQPQHVPEVHYQTHNVHCPHCIH